MELIALNDEQHLYLQFLLNAFRKENRWPTVREVDHPFTLQHPDLDIEDIWQSLPAGLAGYLDINSLDTDVSLTLRGIYQLEPEAPEIALFLKILQICIETYVTQKDREIRCEDIIGNHPDWDKAAIYRTGWLLLREPAIWQSFAGPTPPDMWNCTVMRKIRRFRGITTIEEYLEKRNVSRSHPPTPVLPASNNISIPVDAGFQPQRVVLHSDIQARCWELYEQGDYDNAILNATKAIEVAIRKKAHLADDVVGVDVVNTAFSPKKPLLKYSELDAEQQGMMSLLRGIIQVYKNPQSHRFVGLKDSSECLGVLLMCSTLLSLIDTL